MNEFVLLIGLYHSAAIKSKVTDNTQHVSHTFKLQLRTSDAQGDEAAGSTQTGTAVHNEGIIQYGGQTVVRIRSSTIICGGLTL